MRKTAIAAVLLFSASAAFAQAPVSKPDAKAAGSAAMQSTSSDCEAKAIDKNGKPLSGAAKTSFMKKCEEGSKNASSASCEAKAIGKDGRPLAGAAKTAFMKKCETEAGK